MFQNFSKEEFSKILLKYIEADSDEIKEIILDNLLKELKEKEAQLEKMKFNKQRFIL